MSNITIAWHPLLEFDVAILKVSNNGQFLFILGNDILSENGEFRFKGIENGWDYGLLTFYLK